MGVADEAVLLTDEEILLLTPEERAEVARYWEQQIVLATLEDETDWRRWLPNLFPRYFESGFASHHCEFWDWVWGIELDSKTNDAFIAIWPRGGAKSTSAEAAVVALAARRRRKYGLYVCETQPQADDHVGNISAMLESKAVERAYPALAERLVGKFGNSKGWRRNRLRTPTFTIDALGLDVAARGMKLDEDRPDLIIFDDLDNDNDGPGQVEKKINAITKKLLPAGADDLTVLGIQNLIHPQGVFARLAGLANEEADFLSNRIVSGPIPALKDATFDAEADGSWKIVSGEPTWEGQDLARCQTNVDDWGITAFRTEAQHDTDAKGGGMFDHVVFQHCTRDEVPDLVRVEVWVDPAVTATDNSDAMAIQVDGLGPDRCIYRLRSWEERATPVNALRLAIAWALLEGALRVGVETDQGGDTWRSVYKEAYDAVLLDIAMIREGAEVAGQPNYIAAIVELSGRETIHDYDVKPFFAEEKAGTIQAPKAHRVQQMLPDYEKAGRIKHVIGDHLLLERSLFRFPARKPFDLVDAAFWSWNALRLYGQPARTNTKRNARSFPQPKFTRA